MTKCQKLNPFLYYIHQPPLKKQPVHWLSLHYTYSNRLTHSSKEYDCFIIIIVIIIIIA